MYFFIGTRVSYLYEIKMKAVELKLSGIPTKKKGSIDNCRRKLSKARILYDKAARKISNGYYRLAIWWKSIISFQYYTIGETQDTLLVLDTLNQLTSLPEGTMRHSDHGSVYTSAAYQEAVKSKGITRSMSREGMPADNAPIESFHSTLKSETFYLDGLTRTTTVIVERTARDYIA